MLVCSGEDAAGPGGGGGGRRGLLIEIFCKSSNPTGSFWSALKDSQLF